MEIDTSLKNEVIISRRCKRMEFKHHLIRINWKMGEIINEFRWNKFNGIASGLMIEHSSRTVIERDEIIIRRIRKYGMRDG